MDERRTEHRPRTVPFQEREGKGGTSAAAGPACLLCLTVGVSWQEPNAGNRIESGVPCAAAAAAAATGLEEGRSNRRPPIYPRQRRNGEGPAAQATLAVVAPPAPAAGVPREGVDTSATLVSGRFSVARH